MLETVIKNVPPDHVEYYGFDLFDYYSIRQVEQKLEKTGCKIKLFKGDSMRTLPEAVKSLPKMDLIFIDGGKSPAEAKSDWENSRTLMHEETAVFVHNYGFSGVRRMVDNIPRQQYHVRIIQTSSEGEIALIKKA